MRLKETKGRKKPNPPKTNEKKQRTPWLSSQICKDLKKPGGDRSI